MLFFLIFLNMVYMLCVLLVFWVVCFRCVFWWMKVYFLKEVEEFLKEVVMYF